MPRDAAARAAHDDDGFHRAPLERLVRVGLQRHAASAAQTFIGRDNELRVAVQNPVFQAVRRKAAEHNRVNRADTRAGQHGVGRFGNHGQIEGDAIAFFDAPCLKGVRQTAHVFMQFRITYVFLFGWAVAFPDDGGLLGAQRQMTVDAVIRDVQRAVLEPADRNVVREAGVFDLRIGLDPRQALALFAPKTIRIADGSLVHRRVLRGADPRARKAGFGHRYRRHVRRAPCIRRFSAVQIRTRGAHDVGALFRLACNVS